MPGDTTNTPNTNILNTETGFDIVSVIAEKIKAGAALSIAEETSREQNIEAVEARLRALMALDIDKKPEEISIPTNSVYVDILKKIAAAETQISAGADSVVLDDIPFDIFKQISQNTTPTEKIIAIPSLELIATKTNILETKEADTQNTKSNDLENLAKEYSIETEKKISPVDVLKVESASIKSTPEKTLEVGGNMRAVLQGDTLHGFMSRELLLPSLVHDIGAQYSLLESIFTDARQQTNSAGDTVNSFEKIVPGNFVDITYFINALVNKKNNAESLIEHANNLPATVTMRVIENMPRGARESLMIVTSIAKNKTNPTPEKTAPKDTLLPETLHKKEISQADLLKYILSYLALHELSFKNLAIHLSDNIKDFLKVSSDSTAEDIARRASVFVFELSKKADLEVTPGETVLQFIQRAVTKILEEN